jgi:hypothetical protein
MSKIWITRIELRTMIREMVEGSGMCEECGQMTESCSCPVEEGRGDRRARTWKAKRKGKESPARGSTDKSGHRSVVGKTDQEREHERKHKEQTRGDE